MRNKFPGKEEKEHKEEQEQKEEKEKKNKVPKKIPNNFLFLLG